MIEVGVVEANIPMLLSKSKLKEWGVKIDFLENTMFIRKTSEVIKLKETEQGHLTYPMGKNIKDNEEELVKAIHLVRIKKKYSMSDLKKIHIGHPTTEKIAKLIKIKILRKSMIAVRYAENTRRIHQSQRLVFQRPEKSMKLFALI